MWDSIVRATAADNSIRISAVVSTKLVEEARKKHQTFPIATAALGRSMTGALLLSWGLKEEGTITIRIFGDGPLGGVIVDCNAHGEVRGYVQNPHVDLPLNEQGKLAVGEAVGQGDLHVTKDIGLNEPYTGTTPLISGEIGDDLANYLLQSEQIPSLVAVGVLVNPDLSVAASGGIIIQALPDAPEELLIEIENNIKELKPISTLIQEGNKTQDLIKACLGDIEVKFLEEKPISFKCKCDLERIKGILKSLGEAELTDILEKEGQSEVTCHFCNEKYIINRAELEEILEEVKEETKKD